MIQHREWLKVFRMAQLWLRSASRIKKCAMHFKQTQSFEELEDTRRHSWVWAFVWGHSATVFDFDILHQSVCDSVLHPDESRLQFQRTAMARIVAESCLFLFHVATGTIPYVRRGWCYNVDLPWICCVEFELKIGEAMGFAFFTPGTAHIHHQFAAAWDNFHDSALCCVRSDRLPGGCSFAAAGRTHVRQQATLPLVQNDPG